MMKLTRRDFLKLLSLIPPVSLLPYMLPRHGVAHDNGFLPNIIVLVFDAMTARNLSVYGYPRNTTPSLEKFAQKATVYHSHYAGGSFTVPGTASLLTGLYPWTHRAINQSGLIARKLLGHNIFGLLGPEYNRYAFTQNIWTDILLSQFGLDIDVHLSPGSFGAIEQLTGDKLSQNRDIGYRAYDDFLFRMESVPVSLILGTIQRIKYLRRVNRSQSAVYPLGIPGVIDYSLYFKLEDVSEGLIEHLKSLRSPYFGYYHFWPPHEPYRPRTEFVDLFNNDHWRPLKKANHRLGDKKPFQHLIKLRQRYDEYIANVDSEVERLLDELGKTGILDKSYIIITSDHGQMFERGVEGHITPLLYDPVIHVPLLISSPGQAERQDVYTPTSSVDLLPTLLSLAGFEIPAWCEGTVLPKLGGIEDLNRSIFSIDAKKNPASMPIKTGTVTMRKGKYKIIYYTGYEKDDAFELYDLQEDIEELNDLSNSLKEVFSSMRDELLARLRESNAIIYS